MSKEEAWYKDLREYFYNPSDEVLDKASSVLADRAIDRMQSKSQVTVLVKGSATNSCDCQ